MPVIAVTLIEGYPAAVRQRLCERLTDAAMATIAAPAEGVTVFINEVAPASYMRGRMAKTPGAAPVPPADLCLDFLGHIGTGDFDAAQKLVSRGFEMTFPGDARFTEWHDLKRWAASRYRKIEKTVLRVDESPLGAAVGVYVSGFLSGVLPDGAAFAKIRFIDRFEVREGKITKQEVWNDLATMRPSDA